jgi:uncharacterized membrane protein YedE/YeeE
MTAFTPVASLLGGMLIGVSAVLLMALHGRVAGLTGILSGIIIPLAPDWQWRAAFVAGAIAAPLTWLVAGAEIPFAVPASIPMLIFGGFIVGIGVTFGNGCPSGHGICGIARLSSRSLVAVAAFMTTAFVTVYVVRHIFGG